MDPAAKKRDIENCMADIRYRGLAKYFPGMVGKFEEVIDASEYRDPDATNTTELQPNTSQPRVNDKKISDGRFADEARNMLHEFMVEETLLNDKILQYDERIRSRTNPALLVTADPLSVRGKWPEKYVGTYFPAVMKDEESELDERFGNMELCEVGVGYQVDYYRAGENILWCKPNGQWVISTEAYFDEVISPSRARVLH